MSDCLIVKNLIYYLPYSRIPQCSGWRHSSLHTNQRLTSAIPDPWGTYPSLYLSLRSKNKANEFVPRRSQSMWFSTWNQNQWYLFTLMAWYFDESFEIIGLRLFLLWGNLPNSFERVESVIQQDLSNVLFDLCQYAKMFFDVSDFYTLLHLQFFCWVKNVLSDSKQGVIIPGRQIISVSIKCYWCPRFKKS